MKKNLLQIVQNILSDMDSDGVNSISDTLESEQVAQCVATIFEQIQTEWDLPEQVKMYRLGNTTDATNGKTRLLLADASVTLHSLLYNNKRLSGGDPAYTPLRLVSNDEFLGHTINSAGEDQQWPEDANLVFRVRNDRGPNMVTLVGTRTLVADAYLADKEATLQSSSAVGYGGVEPGLVIDDDTIIDLDGILMPLLERNASELAFDLYAGGAPRKIIDLARKARVRAQRNKDKIRSVDRTGSDYGRHGKRANQTTGNAWGSPISSGTAKPLPPYFS